MRPASTSRASRFGFAAQRFEPLIPHILGKARAA
jgi:hypothetical protein